MQLSWVQSGRIVCCETQRQPLYKWKVLVLLLQRRERLIKPLLVVRVLVGTGVENSGIRDWRRLVKRTVEYGFGDDWFREYLFRDDSIYGWGIEESTRMFFKQKIMKSFLICKWKKHCLIKKINRFQMKSLVSIIWNGFKVYDHSNWEARCIPQEHFNKWWGDFWTISFT